MFADREDRSCAGASSWAIATQTLQTSIHCFQMLMNNSLRELTTIANIIILQQYLPDRPDFLQSPKPTSQQDTLMQDF